MINEHLPAQLRPKTVYPEDELRNDVQCPNCGDVFCVRDGIVFLIPIIDGQLERFVFEPFCSTTCLLGAFAEEENIPH